MKTAYHITTAASLTSIEALGLIPQAGKRASKVDDFGIFLFQTVEDAEDAVMGWLGDEFDEDEELVLLEVIIPETAKTESGPAEIVCFTPIPPENIVSVTNLG